MLIQPVIFCGGTGIRLWPEGQGMKETGTVAAVTGDKSPAVAVGDVLVKIDPRYFRPTEVETLPGDPTKAKEKLGWVPEIALDQMIKEMIAHGLDQARRHALLKQHGYDMSVGVE
jgi:GDPmannose 4,6-dehydratase